MGRSLFALALHYIDAGANLFSIQQHRARAALRHAAAHLRTGELQLVAQHKQQRRILQQLGQKPTDLERYIHQLSDSIQTLFYHVVMSDPAYFLTILYDPTVGEACLNFGHIYRRRHGMYISMNQKGRIHEVLKNWPR